MCVGLVALAFNGPRDGSSDVRVRAYWVISIAVVASAAGGLGILPILGSVALFPLALREGALTMGALGLRRVRVVFSSVALAAVSVLGLVRWLDSKGLYVVPVVPQWLPRNAVLIVCVLALVSLVNAFYEEALWRFLLWDHATGRTWLGAVFLSAAFGVVHLSAIPDGWFGMVLTTAFSLAAFALRVLARGSIVPCVLVHFIADLVLLLSLANLG